MVTMIEVHAREVIDRRSPDTSRRSHRGRCEQMTVNQQLARQVDAQVQVRQAQLKEHRGQLAQAGARSPR